MSHSIPEPQYGQPMTGEAPINVQQNINPVGETPAMAQPQMQQIPGAPIAQAPVENGYPGQAPVGIPQGAPIAQAPVMQEQAQVAIQTPAPLEPQSAPQAMSQTAVNAPAPMEAPVMQEQAPVQGMYQAPMQGQPQGAPEMQAPVVQQQVYSQPPVQGMPQQQYIPQGAPQGMPGQMPQQGGQHQAPRKNNFITVIKDNYTTISLFEFSAGFDPSEQYPQAFGFVMGVPSVPDSTKQSGKRYVPDQKIVMKFSTQEIRALGQTMLDIAVFKGAAGEFNKFSDPSKNTYAAGNAQQGMTKSLKLAYDQNKNNVIINISYGQQKVFIPVKDLQDAKGLGWSLINAGNVADLKLAEYMMAHNIKTEIPDEVPGHITGQEQQAPMQGMPPQGQPQYQQPAPQQQYAAPQQQYAAPYQNNIPGQ